MECTEFPTCPYCLQIHLNLWEISFDGAGEAVVVCDCCERKFLVEQEEDGSYSSVPFLGDDRDKA